MNERRTDSGVTLIQRQMPVFTQQAPAYDVLVAADESEVFAPYLPYRTWDPRPVAGSAGLVPKSWDAAQDQWGAVQMQNRFLKLNSRHMTALDMQAWTGARMIGEAASRKKLLRNQKKNGRSATRAALRLSRSPGVSWSLGSSTRP